MRLLLIIFWLEKFKNLKSTYISWFGGGIIASDVVFALNAISWFLCFKHFLGSKYVVAKLKRLAIIHGRHLLRKNNWFSIDLNGCSWIILIIKVSPMPFGHIVGLSSPSSDWVRALWVDLNSLRAKISLPLILVHFGGASDSQPRLQINIVIAQIWLWAFLHQHLVGVQKVDRPIVPLAVVLHARQARLSFIKLP